MNLSEQQEEGLEKFKNLIKYPEQKELIIEGYSGCGKTYLLKAMLEWLSKFNKIFKIMSDNPSVVSNVILSATTHKAAAVMSKSTGQVAGTIHSIIGLKLVKDFNTGEEKLQPTNSTRTHLNKSTILFIDESSFIDPILKSYIDRYCKECKIVYLGDPAQLKAVKAPNCPVFQPTYISPNFKTKLKEPIRFKEETSINKIGAMFREAVETKKFEPIVPIDDTVEFIDKAKLNQVVKEEYLGEEYDQANITLLAWRNASVLSFNNAIQKARNPGKPLLIKGASYVSNSTVTSGNELVLFNEEVVKIHEVVDESELLGVPYTEIAIHGGMTLVKVITDHAKYKTKLKQLAKEAKKGAGWGDYWQLKENLADLRLPYASTVHKAQGSTHKKVIIDLGDIGTNNNKEEVARLLYVAITRASEKVYLYGTLPKKYQ